LGSVEVKFPTKYSDVRPTFDVPIDVKGERALCETRSWQPEAHFHMLVQRCSTWPRCIRIAPSRQLLNS
jgi:hypothetical protein